MAWPLLWAGVAIGALRLISVTVMATHQHLDMTVCATAASIPRASLYFQRNISAPLAS